MWDIEAIQAADIDAAGRALHAAIRAVRGDDATDLPVIVLAGPGRTGAVGIAAARRMQAAGEPVRLVLTRAATTMHPLTAAQAAGAVDEGITPWTMMLPPEEMDQQEPLPWATTPLIVDALLGRGIVGDPRDEVADLIQLINAARRPRLAVDVPSGLQGDEGWILSPCVDATVTLAFDAPGAIHREGWPVVGRLLVADLESATLQEMPR